MPNYREKMQNLVAGDYRGYQRRITGLPAEDAIAKAYLTVKGTATDADPGLFQKTITATDVAGQGQITDTGLVTGVAVLFFRLLTTETALLVPGTTYYYDVSVILASGAAPITPIKGTIVAIQGVTAAVT
jgi:hypothetical protein